MALKRASRTADSMFVRAKRARNNSTAPHLCVPSLGLGTYRLKGAACERSVRLAVRDVGFRLVDTAHIYANEREVGRAVRLSGVPREQVFVQTKLWRSHQGNEARTGRARAPQALPRQLKVLGLEAVDLWLMHWPGPGRYLAKPPVCRAASQAAPKNGDRGCAGSSLLPAKMVSRHVNTQVPSDWTPQMRLETYGHMVADLRAGRAKALGVCNMSAAQLRALLAYCDARALPRPAALQQEFHPLLQQREVRALCRHEGIMFQADAPLGAGLLQLERLQPVADAATAHGATAAQVLLAWALARADSVVVKATSASHLRENFAAQQLELSAQELKKIDMCEEAVAVRESAQRHEAEMGAAQEQPESEQQQEQRRHTMATWLREQDPSCYD